jgi:hypothetical protein
MRENLCVLSFSFPIRTLYKIEYPGQISTNQDNSIIIYKNL